MGAVRRKGELKDIRRIESRFLQLLNLFFRLPSPFSLSFSITTGDEEAPVEEYKLSDSLVADFKDAFERIDKEGTGDSNLRAGRCYEDVGSSTQTRPAPGMYRRG